jgi:hypothetical protein
MKKAKAHQQGMSLVVVPCWWDGTIEKYTHPNFLSCTNSLIRIVSSIYFQRPDLFEQCPNAYPIYLNPPHDFFKGTICFIIKKAY